MAVVCSVDFRLLVTGFSRASVHVLWLWSTKWDPTDRPFTWPSHKLWQTECKEAKEGEELSCEGGPQVWHPAELAETPLKDGPMHSQLWPNKWNCCLGSEELALGKDTAGQAGGGAGQPGRDRRGHRSTGDRLTPPTSAPTHSAQLFPREKC